MKRRTQKTNAPDELARFIERCKQLGARGYKGEFVASDGTRIPVEFMFEKPAHDRSREDG